MHFFWEKVHRLCYCIVKRNQFNWGAKMFGHSDKTANNDNQTSAVDSQLPSNDSTMQPQIISASDAKELGSPENDASANTDLNDIPAVPLVTTDSNMPVANGGEHKSTKDDKDDDATDLLDLKQKALHDLSPLVNHLEQTPEEKFRTTMMMIQASDDRSLLPKAYEAAQGITDDKSKAQALLDVVNEINYFTQN